MIVTAKTWAMLCLVQQSYLTLCDPMDCSLTGSSVQGESPGEDTEVGCHYAVHMHDVCYVFYLILKFNHHTKLLR